jgi:hypothetical protein
MEAYLKSNTPSDSAKYRASWVTEEDKIRHHEAFGDNYEACLNWYKRSTSSLGVDEEKELLGKGLIKRGGKAARETLMVAGLQDAVCSAGRAREAMRRVVEKGCLKVSSPPCRMGKKRATRWSTNEDCRLSMLIADIGLCSRSRTRQIGS